MHVQRAYLEKYVMLTCIACFFIYTFVILRLSEESKCKFFLSNNTILDFTPAVRSELRKCENMKYILTWASAETELFIQMGHGQSVFLENKCEFTNCYVTDNRNFFLDVSDFDAVAFDGKEASKVQKEDLPKERMSSQIYLFAMMESSRDYPICNERWDNFFNWTWTYRLDSNKRLGYISFYDKQGPHKRLGPKIDMDWLSLEMQSDMELSQRDIENLANKTKAVAWFVSNFSSSNDMEGFSKQLKEEMIKHNMDIDVYSDCEKNLLSLLDMTIPEKRCSNMLMKEYFFYLSFENSFAEDYVTGKVITALDNLVVPVVYGGADYTRFLPPNSYLNARALGPKETAKQMYELMSSPAEYRRMFYWRPRLQYRLTWDHKDMCDLCAALNDPQRLENASVVRDLRAWWNRGNAGSCG